jgi:hypothetical protein
MIEYQRTIEGILTTFPEESTKLTDPPHQESQRRNPPPKIQEIQNPLSHRYPYQAPEFNNKFYTAG